MGESELHHRLKRIAVEQLQKEGYQVYIEPKFPPTPVITWRGYRPDLLGIDNEGDDQNYVVIECETNPSESKIDKKTESLITVQYKIIGKTNFRQIVVLPSGRLGRLLHTMIMKNWEVWIANCSSSSLFKIQPK